MQRNILFATVLTASTALASLAYAADQTTTPPAPQTSPAQSAVDKDILKLSSDGSAAFRDIHAARMALFDANPTQAKSLVDNAETAFKKARTDDTAFVKAEADLRGRTGAAPSQPSADATKPVAWLPIDGQLTLGEDFVATPQKTAAVADARKALSAGDRQTAAEKLKLAGIDVNFTMAVVPLDKTAAQVSQAAADLGQGKYYEANVSLKQAEDGLRFDTVNAFAVPQKTAANAPAKTGTETTTTKAAPTGTVAAKPAS